MEEKKMYTISLQGCDDHTNIDMELSDAEFKLVERIEEASSNKSTYQCMPVLVVYEKVDD